MSTALHATYMHEVATSTARILQQVAERQPLMYLAWLDYAGRNHEPCGHPTCPICTHLHELVIPLTEV